VLGWLGKLFLGSGKLTPQLWEELATEGLVLLEEGLPGSVRYTHFKAPGRRMHGKVTPERMALGISRERFVVYCKSGRAKLADSEFTSPNLRGVGVSLDDDDKVVITIDYDKLDVDRVSGRVALHVRTPNARRIAEELRARIAPAPA
jgi:hypothetical protein